MIHVAEIGVSFWRRFSALISELCVMGFIGVRLSRQTVETAQNATHNVAKVVRATGQAWTTPMPVPYGVHNRRTGWRVGSVVTG